VAALARGLAIAAQGSTVKISLTMLQAQFQQFISTAEEGRPEPRPRKPRARRRQELARAGRCALVPTAHTDYSSQ
jgi:hypothetical protein